MTDVLTPEQRRKCMSTIRCKNTKPEKRVRKALWSKGLRYRLGYKIPGNPDLVFVSSRIAVFIDGCFWHGCPDHFNQPQTNADFWKTKIEKNIARDRLVDQELSRMGWKVFRCWEHDVKNDNNLDLVVKTITDLVKNKG